MGTISVKVNIFIFGLLMFGTLANCTIIETELDETAPGVCFMEKSSVRNRPRVYVKPVQTDEDCVDECSHELESLVLMETYLVKTNKTTCCPGWYYMETEAGPVCEPMNHEPVKKTWPWMYIAIGVLLSILPIHAFSVVVTTLLLMFTVKKQQMSKPSDVDNGKGHSTVAYPSNILIREDVHTSNDVKILTRNATIQSVEEANTSDDHVIKIEPTNFKLKYPMKTDIMTEISTDMDPIPIEPPFVKKIYSPLSNIELPVKPYVSVEDMRIVYPENTKQPAADKNDPSNEFDYLADLNNDLVEKKDVTVLKMESPKKPFVSIEDMRIVYPGNTMPPPENTKDPLKTTHNLKELDDNFKKTKATMLDEPSKKSIISVEDMQILYPKTTTLSKSETKESQTVSKYSSEISNDLNKQTRMKTETPKKSYISVEEMKIVYPEKSDTNNPQKARESVELSDPINKFHNSTIAMEQSKTPYASISDMRIIYPDQTKNSSKETMDIAKVDRMKTGISTTPYKTVSEKSITYSEMKSDHPLVKKREVTYPSNTLVPNEPLRKKGEIIYPSNYEDLLISEIKQNR